MKTLLILDKASTHSDVEHIQSGDIKATFLLPNMTSLCQPMDQGVCSEEKIQTKTAFIYCQSYRPGLWHDWEAKKNWFVGCSGLGWWIVEWTWATYSYSFLEKANRPLRKWVSRKLKGREKQFWANRPDEEASDGDVGEWMD